jgi:hypothetical protein
MQMQFAVIMSNTQPRRAIHIIQGHVDTSTLVNIFDILYAL